MKKEIGKPLLYVLVALFVLYSVIARVGMTGLLVSFIDLPSLLWIIIGVLFTGLNFKLKDVCRVLLYPLHKNKIAERPPYYKAVLKGVSGNIIRFALLSFVLGVLLVFAHCKNIDAVLAGLGILALPLLYALVIMIFVIKPVETAISQMSEAHPGKVGGDGEDSVAGGKIKLKQILSALWSLCAVLGILCLMLLIATGLDSTEKDKEYKVTGKVTKLYRATWDWGEQRYAFVETDDGKGETVVEIFRYESDKIKEGDEIPLIIRCGTSPGFKRMYTRIDREEMRRLKSLSDSQIGAGK